MGAIHTGTGKGVDVVNQHTGAVCIWFICNDETHIQRGADGTALYVRYVGGFFGEIYNITHT